MSHIPIEDLKELIKDTIYDVLFRQYNLMPKVTEPKRNEECKLYIESNVMVERNMIHPCGSLQDVMDGIEDIPVGSHVPFDWRKFNSSKIKFCPYCGVKFSV